MVKDRKIKSQLAVMVVPVFPVMAFCVLQQSLCASFQGNLNRRTFNIFYIVLGDKNTNFFHLLGMLCLTSTLFHFLLFLQ